MALILGRRYLFRDLTAFTVFNQVCEFLRNILLRCYGSYCGLIQILQLAERL